MGARDTGCSAAAAAGLWAWGGRGGEGEGDVERVAMRVRRGGWRALRTWHVDQVGVKAPGSVTQSVF